MTILVRETVAQLLGQLDPDMARRLREAIWREYVTAEITSPVGLTLSRNFHGIDLEAAERKIMGPRETIIEIHDDSDPARRTTYRATVPEGKFETIWGDPVRPG